MEYQSESVIEGTGGGICTEFFRASRRHMNIAFSVRCYKKREQHGQKEKKIQSVWGNYNVGEKQEIIWEKQMESR